MKPYLLALILLPGCAVAEDEVAHCAIPKNTLERTQNPNEIQVHLKPEKEKFLIGEPVRFTVTVKNNSQQDIEAWVMALKYQMQIFISGGKGFDRYEDGMQEAVRIIPSTETLKPGGTESYPFKVLYSSWMKAPEKDKLAFPLAGTYCIQVKYPLFPDRKMFKSNIVHITVEKPTGDDAKVWQKINQPTMLRFLQSGRLLTDEEDIPVELADLLEKFPKSGYAEELKRTLRWHYDQKKGGMHSETLKSDPWMQRLRKLLDIKLEKDPGLFPEDKRLDVKIQYHYPNPTPFGDVFRDISQQSGVRLELDPAFKAHTLNSISISETLRKFMVDRTANIAKWIKDGEGYKLVPEPEEKK